MSLHEGSKRWRGTPAKYRELVAIAILAYRDSPAVTAHMKRAIRLGATKRELLDAIETCLIPGGAGTFLSGLKALMEIEEEKQKLVEENRNSHGT